MFGNELFIPAATRLTLALAGGLSLIVVAERHHLRELRTGVLFKRWRTWAITAPLFGAAVMGPGVLGVVFVMALSFQGLREYATIVGLPRAYRIALLIAGLASAPIAVSNLTVWRGMPPILLVAATLTPLWMQDVERGVQRLAYAAFGFAFIPWLLGYFLLIRDHVSGGRGVLLALGCSVAISDVAAFAVGNLFGHHRLAPKLSPAKTWEGVGGNIVGAYLGFFLMSFALPGSMPLGLRWSLPTIVAAGCVWGDLVESLIKRQFAVKDAGSWLPGFGGLLDRIDSLLVALPLAYTALVLWR
ncbi:MAG TPA: phosphatidate cytidylyltransferase [Actinomycetota bacterium]|nr:phosphatidate cytidylyltransferase [Actinomycetota bacterium]